MDEIEIIPESIQIIKMSDSEYFSSEYRDYISNSRLGLLNPDEDGSSEKYNSGFSNTYSDSFELGSAVHAITLQPKYYTISDIRKPSGKLGLFVESFYEFRQKGFSIYESIALASKHSNYYSGKLTEARIRSAIKIALPFYLQRYKIVDDDKISTLYLSDSIYFKYSECMKGLDTSKVKETLYPKSNVFPTDPEVYNEYAILAEVYVKKEGVTKKLKVKAKLDNFTIDHNNKVITLNDLKTTGKPVNFFMGNNVKVFTEETGESIVWYDGSFQKFHYYRQMG